MSSITYFYIFCTTRKISGRSLELDKFQIMLFDRYISKVRGRGIEKIFNFCKDAGLPEPEIKEMNGGLEISLYKSEPVLKGLADELADGLVDGLVDTQMKILQLMKSNHRISKREMAANIGTSTTTIDKHIKILKEKGIIARKGSDRTGFWQLVDKK